MSGGKAYPVVDSGMYFGSSISIISSLLIIIKKPNLQDRHFCSFLNISIKPYLDLSNRA